LASFLLWHTPMRVRPGFARALKCALRISHVLGLAWLVSSCIEGNDEDQDARERGDLGVGDFEYGCLNSTDLTCEESDHGLPIAIAVGGRFDLKFETASGPRPSVIAPVSDFVGTAGGSFQVRAPGVFVLLAVNGNREVVDLKHLRGAQIEEIRVQEEGSDLPSTTLRLDRRQRARVVAIPYEIRGVQLGGALSYSWSSGDDSLVTIETLTALNRVRLVAGDKAGKTELKIDVGGRVFSVAVEVGTQVAMSDAGVATDAGGDAQAAEVDAASVQGDAGSAADGATQADGGAP
jgi:hypothetical protein